jgi:RimK-like ATP-grasp domain/Tubulin-tyrosine ligase family
VGNADAVPTDAVLRSSSFGGAVASAATGIAEAAEGLRVEAVRFAVRLRREPAVRSEGLPCSVEAIDACRNLLDAHAVGESPRPRLEIELRLDAPLAGGRLVAIAERVAPALLVLLGDGSGAPLRLVQSGPSLKLSFSLDRTSCSEHALAAGLGVLVALAEAADLPASLLAHPPICASRRDGATVAILQRYPNGEPTIARGRLTPLPAVTETGEQISVHAQKSLMALMLFAEGDVARFVAPSGGAALAASVLGEATLAVDRRHRVSLRRWHDEPVSPVRTVALVDVEAELSLDPRGTGRPLARMARALSRQNRFETVVVCPWHSLHLRARTVEVAGDLVFASEGELYPARLDTTQLDALLYYPIGTPNALEVPGSEPREQDALERLRRRRVRVRDADRRSIVERLLFAAEARGVLTNLAGRHGSWWRKDRLEFGLRAYTRATGRLVRRPQTFVVTGSQVAGVLDAFARRGLSCIVKPATGTAGEGLQIVQPGGVALALADVNYVVQELPASPLLVGDKKVDLRFYLQIDTTARRASRRLPPVFVRPAPAPFEPGRLVSEVTNTAYRERLNLPVAIRPLEAVDEWSPELRAWIRGELDAISDELLDALFWAFGRGPRRALLWGLDALPVLGETGPELQLLELNVYPTLYRGDPVCDDTVDAMLRYGYGASLLGAARGFRQLRPRRTRPRSEDTVLGTLLTRWPRHPTASALQEACRMRSVALQIADSVDPRSDFVFQWGYEEAEQPREVQRFCLDAGIDLINPNVLGKGAQYRALSAAGVPIPEARICRTLEQALGAAWDLRFPVVMKPIFGTLSRGVVLVEDEEALVREWTGRPRLVQRLLPEGNRAVRLLVVGTRVTHAVMRHAHDGFHATWDMGRTATLEPYDPSVDVAMLAVEACQTLGVDIGGVDLVPSPGGPSILEVNHRRVEFHVAPLHGRDAIEQIATYLTERAFAKRALAA